MIYNFLQLIFYQKGGAISRFMRPLNKYLQQIDYQLLQGTIDHSIDDLVINSKKATATSLFICLKGANFDAHNFIFDALKNGCHTIIIQENIDLNAIPAHITIIKVADTRLVLAQLSAFHFDYPAKKLTCIAVTGTKGKSSTAWIIKQLLEAQNLPTGLIGTDGIFYHNLKIPTQNTTPESYDLQKYLAQMVNSKIKFVVLEVSSQAQKLKRTAGIIFDYAIFTNISPDHIGPNEHHDFNEYLQCKLSLFAQSKTGIVNLDDSHALQFMHTSAKTFTYSLKQTADLTAQNLKLIHHEKISGCSFDLYTQQQLLASQVSTCLIGQYNISNILAALSLLKCLNIPLPLAQLQSLKINGRLELVLKNNAYTVFVDYAHNEASLQKVLLTLKQLHPRRLIVVFGCGGNRSKQRRYGMGRVAGKYADISILTEDNSRFENIDDILNDIKETLTPLTANYLEILDRTQAIKTALLLAQPQDIILVAGKGAEDYNECQGKKIPFKDREQILAIANQLNLDP